MISISDRISELKVHSFLAFQVCHRMQAVSSWRAFNSPPDFSLLCAYHQVLKESVPKCNPSHLTRDSCQINWHFLQWKKQFSIDSPTSPQNLQISSTFRPLFFSFSPTGRRSWLAFHKKIWIFFLIFKPHTFYRSFLSPVSFCFWILPFLWSVAF